VTMFCAVTLLCKGKQCCNVCMTAIGSSLYN
jgi:hypothetical protein